MSKEDATGTLGVDSEVSISEIEELSTRIDRLTSLISNETFDEWYREREFARNILEGRPYFNGPSKIQDPERHSPSGLMKCHRKRFYNQLNAPEEAGDPTGIFWVGTQFEEDIILSFFDEAIVGEDEYVTNSIWVDFTVNTSAGELQIKGETDPVIVDSDSNPILLTEIKTRQSIGDLQEPSSHHLAQAHAYMKGLTEAYDRTVSEAVILYGGRKKLNIKAFEVEFDPYFWRNSILKWASTHTTYRLNSELPPADPEYSWECKFCSYRERCGQGEGEYRDTGPVGLLPLYSDYPRDKLVDYLLAHDDAKLTPTLAQVYPDLAEQYGSFDWQCLECGSDFAWDDIEWYSHSAQPPECPECEKKGSISWLRGPAPEDQHSIGGEEDAQ